MFLELIANATADTDVVTLVNAQAETGIDTILSVLGTNLPLILGVILSIYGFGFVVRLIKRGMSK